MSNTTTSGSHPSMKAVKSVTPFLMSAKWQDGTLNGRLKHSVDHLDGVVTGV
jgi:hypothetical protein